MSYVDLQHYLFHSLIILYLENRSIEFAFLKNRVFFILNIVKERSVILKGYDEGGAFSSWLLLQDGHHEAKIWQSFVFAISFEETAKRENQLTASQNQFTQNVPLILNMVCLYPNVNNVDAIVCIRNVRTFALMLLNVSRQWAVLLVRSNTLISIISFTLIVAK